MTLKIDIKGYGSLVDCDSVTDWDDVTISVGLEEDIFLQGAAAVSAAASNKAGEIYYDIETAITRDLDFDVGGQEEGQLIFSWINITTLKTVDTLANNGISIRLYNDLSNYADWTIGGSGAIDNFRAGKGGFVCFALDPRRTPTAINGSWDSGAVSLIGFHLDTTASAKSQNLIVDHIIIGEGVVITGTDVNGWEDLADYCNDFSNRAWGMIQYDDSEGVIYSMGKIYIGSAFQSGATSLTDEGRVIQFIHTDYYSGGAWHPMVDPDYHEIIIQDNLTYSTTWEDGAAVGGDRGRNGSLIIGDSGAVKLRLSISGANSSSVVKLYGTTLKYVENGITGTEDTDYRLQSVTFDNCGQFDPKGGMRIRECTFSNSLDDSGALLWNDNIDILGGNFIANSFGIQHDQTGTVTYSGIQFSANTFDGFLTASTGLLTINVIDSNVGTFKSGADTEVDIENAVSLNIYVKDTYGSGIHLAQTAIYKSSNDEELMNEDTNVDGLATESYNYLGNEDIYYRVRKSSSGATRYVPFEGIGTITTDGFTSTVILYEDTNVE